MHPAPPLAAPPRWPVAIGLGTNQNDRAALLTAAIRALVDDGLVADLRASGVYASDAMLPDGAPADWNAGYLNQVVVGETMLPPHALLDGLQSIERRLGRGPHARWAPRLIDLDLLLYGDARLDDERLRVPHPGLLDRPFVLLPLADIAGDWRLPGDAESIAAKAEALRARGGGELPWRTRPAARGDLV